MQHSEEEIRDNISNIYNKTFQIQNVTFNDYVSLEIAQHTALADAQYLK